MQFVLCNGTLVPLNSEGDHVILRENPFVTVGKVAKFSTVGGAGADTGTSKSWVLMLLGGPQLSLDLSSIHA